jgi:hypothetical protein
MCSISRGAVTRHEQLFFNQFRLGRWQDFFAGVQFSPDPEALDQFFRAMVPDTAPLEQDLLVDSIAALFDKIGPGILVTHSHAGRFGWLAAMQNRNIKAVVSFEPGSGFVFPDGEAPPPMPSSNGTLAGMPVPLASFMPLTEIPIIAYYGDNIPSEPTDIAGHDNWRVRFAMARLWVDAVNRHGGDARLVHLPDLGIHGNTHFLYSDLNNVQIADQMSSFLAEKGLD